MVRGEGMLAARMALRTGRFDGVLVAGAMLAGLAWWLARLGPVEPPDTGSFAAAAAALAAPGGGWFGNADLHATALPWSFYRAPLYPLLILAAQSLLGAAWPWGLVTMQLALAALATFAFHGALAGLAGSRVLALFGALAQGFSFAIVLHPAILSDSLYASLLCLALALLLRGGVAGGLRPTRALLAGTCLGLATLLREAGAYLHLLWLPLILVAGGGGPRRVGIALLVLGPMLAAPLALGWWNLVRTGSPFLSTVGQVVYLQALLPLAAQGLPVFQGDPLLAQTAAATMPPFTNVEVVALNQALFAEHGMLAPQLAALAQASWARAWTEYPAAMAVASARRIRAHYLFTLFLPLENFAQVALWAEGAPRLMARFDRLLRAALNTGAPELLLGALLLLACRGLAAGAMLGFLAAPLTALRRRGDQRARLAAACWPILPGTLALHALVHLEIRYFTPALPAAIAASMWTIAVLRRARAARPG